MTSGETTATADDGGLLGKILADARGDDAQLRALHSAITGAVDLPADVHVVGEPLVLVAVEYGGNPRRGLVARCRREDGGEHRIALADVELRARGGALYLAAYRRWLGVEAAATAPHARPRRHRVSEDDLDPSRPVELVVLAVAQRVARCRLLGRERVITLRPRSLDRVVAGQIVTVRPAKHWTHGGHPYLSGEIIGRRTDAAALGLAPLALRSAGVWDPADEDWGEAGESLGEWIKPIIARGPRRAFEMEQVRSWSDPGDPEADALRAANELEHVGDLDGARQVLAKLLETDLRCLDAHAHLGNMWFRFSPQWALGHYEVGVRIGELSLGDAFDGVLGWGLAGNRPFLRCMRGYGSCLWRLERWEDAARVLDRMSWLDPADGQGVRSLLPRVRAREPWTDDEAGR